MENFNRPDNPTDLNAMTIVRHGNILEYDPERRGYEVEVIKDEY